MELSVNRSLNHWWVFVLRGALFIAAGIYMIASPGSGYAALGFFFGLVILLAGVAELTHVSRYRGQARTWHLVLGIIDILLGIILMGHVAIGVTIIRLIVGIWFLFRGISLFSFSRVTGSSWILTLGGILTIIFALLIIFNPIFGAMTIIIYTGIAFILNGIFNVWQGILLK